MPRARTRPASGLSGLILLLGLLATPLLEAEEPRAGFFRSIVVGDEETVRQVACIACSVRVEGVVAGNAYVLFGRLDNRGSINGDSIVIGGISESAGPIGGNAYLVGGLLRVSASVGGDLITVLGDLDVASPDVEVGGNAWSVIGQQAGLAPESVQGTVKAVNARQAAQLLMSGLLGGVLVVALAVAACLMVLTGLCYLVLGPARLRVVAEASTESPIICFLIGLGTCFALAVVGVALAALLPISIPVGVAHATASVTGYAGLAFGIGRNLLGRLRPFPATLIASLALACLQAIPVVGWSVLVVLWNVAVGAAVMSGFGTSRDWLARRAQGRLAVRTQAGGAND